jgi:hypothetical protein
MNRYGYYVGLMVSPVLVVTVRILPDRVRMILNLKSNVIPKGFQAAPRRQVSEAPLSPRMECMLNNVRNVVSSSLRSSR